MGKTKILDYEKTSGEESPSWVPLWRDTARLIDNDLITPSEYCLLCWMRNNANVYGIFRSTISSLSETLFKGSYKINSVYKMIIKLKKLRQVWYGDRKGKKGTYEFHLDRFLTPDKNMKSIQDRFDTSSEGELLQNQSEVSPSNQRFKEKNGAVRKAKKNTEDKVQIRGDNNDNYTEKDKDKNNEESLLIKNSSYKGKYKTEEFNPKSSNDFECLRLAQLSGEKYLDGYLPIGEKYPSIINETYSEIKDYQHTGKKIDNLPAYVQGILIKKLKSKIGG